MTPITLTKCPRGHLLSRMNVYLGPDGTRGCRTCRRTEELEVRRAEVKRRPPIGVTCQACGRDFRSSGWLHRHWDTCPGPSAPPRQAPTVPIPTRPTRPPSLPPPLPPRAPTPSPPARTPGNRCCCGRTFQLRSNLDRHQRQCGWHILRRAMDAHRARRGESP